MTTVAEKPIRSSVVSECARYRYLLTEDWGPGDRSITWVMLNPPGNATVEDETTRHVGSFSRHWGYDRLAIVNLFAFQALEPEQLSGVEDPVGPKNRWFVHQAVTSAELVVVGWGDGLLSAGSRPKTLDDLVELRRANAAMLCFGLTTAGNPLHPARIPESMIPVVWTAR
ncbi:MAG: DUF1643 domain-containing protein [Acidimicrobiales bacterium]|jgi:hypothetical protein